MKNKIVKLSLSLTKIVAISNLLLIQSLVSMETQEEYQQRLNSQDKRYNLLTKNFNDYMTNQGCNAKVQAIIEGLKLNTLNKDNKEKKNNFKNLLNKRKLEKDEKNIFSKILFQNFSREKILNKRPGIIDPTIGDQRCQSNSFYLGELSKKENLTDTENIILNSAVFIQNQQDNTFIEGTPILFIESMYPNNLILNEFNRPIIEKIGSSIRNEIIQSATLPNVLDLVDDEKIGTEMISYAGKGFAPFIKVLQKIVTDSTGLHYDTKQETSDIIPFYQTLDARDKAQGNIDNVVILKQNQSNDKTLHVDKIITIVDHKNNEEKEVHIKNHTNNYSLTPNYYDVSQYIPKGKSYQVTDSIIIRSPDQREDITLFLDQIDKNKVNNDGLAIIDNLQRESFCTHPQLEDNSKTKTYLGDNLIDIYHKDNKYYNEYKQYEEKKGTLASALMKLDENNNIIIRTKLGNQNAPVSSVYHVHTEQGK
jgi:hypothetical protein